MIALATAWTRLLTTNSGRCPLLFYKRVFCSSNAIPIIVKKIIVLFVFQICILIAYYKLGVILINIIANTIIWYKRDAEEIVIIIILHGICN